MYSKSRIIKEDGRMKKQKVYVDYDGDGYTADEGIENHGVIDRCAFCMEEKKKREKAMIL
jgi:hypothetical protein